MRPGWEGYVTKGQVHPVTGTISFGVDVFRSRDIIACVSVSMDIYGTLHVWGDSTWEFPTPELTGHKAEFHLGPWANVIDISDVLPLDEIDPNWGGAS